MRLALYALTCHASCPSRPALAWHSWRGSPFIFPLLLHWFCQSLFYLPPPVSLLFPLFPFSVTFLLIKSHSCTHIHTYVHSYIHSHIHTCAIADHLYLGGVFEVAKLCFTWPRLHNFFAHSWSRCQIKWHGLRFREWWEESRRGGGERERLYDMEL